MNRLAADIADMTTGTAIAIGKDDPRFIPLRVDELAGYPEATVHYAYCAGIETWGLDMLGQTLSAIVRILKPSGVARIATKDLDAVVHGYLLDWDDAPETGMTRAQRLNDWRKNETAVHVFNEDDLRTALETAGFVDIWRLPAGASSIGIFQNCETSRDGELVLEGRKPAFVP